MGKSKDGHVKILNAPPFLPLHLSIPKLEILGVYTKNIVKMNTITEIRKLSCYLSDPLTH